MSNPASLYVADVKQCIDSLKNIDRTSDNPLPLLYDKLEDFNSDSYTMELSELYQRRGSSLGNTETDAFLRIVLWSWLDNGTKLIGISPSDADSLGLDLAITPEQITERASMIMRLDAQTIAAALFQQNDVWSTVDALADYLEIWVDSFREALDSGKGVFYKIWV